jgi:hypothetical protein
MEGHSPPRLSTAERLPIELIQNVFSALTDVQSLRSAAICCPVFFFALKDAENIITTRVLSTQVGLDVLPEAIAALNPRVCNILLGKVSKTSPCFILAKDDALLIGKFHACVAAFTQLIIPNILSNKPFDVPKISSPTYAEICRFHRALYRFEVYRNLFRERLERMSIQGQKNIFFANFSPWESEQLGCVHDALVRTVSPGINLQPKVIASESNDEL